MAAVRNEEGNETARTDAAHAHNFDRGILIGVAIEQYLPVARERITVDVDKGVRGFVSDVGGVEHEWWLIHDPQFSGPLGDYFGVEILRHSIASPAFERLSSAAGLFVGCIFEREPHIDLVVPDVKWALRGKVPEVFAIGAHRGYHDATALVIRN